MKIALINYNLKWEGGGQRLIYELVQGLMKRGHVVHIYVPDTEYDPGSYAHLQAGLVIRPVKAPAPYMWTPPYNISIVMRVWYKIKKELWLIEMGKRMAHALREPYDVVSIHDLAYKIAKPYRKYGGKARVVWTVNDPPPYIYLPHPESYLYDRMSYAYNKAKDFVERKHFRSVDLATVLNRFSVRWANARGVPAVIVRPGADYDKFYQPVKDFTGRAKQKKVQLMAMGILNIYRGYEKVIEAVKILREWGYDASAHIITRDFFKKDWLRNSLIQMVHDWHLEPHVTVNFEGETEEGLHRTYRESDVFVLSIHLPPPRDGFGWQLIGIEAMASGLPLVISKKNDITEILEDGKTALFYDPTKPAEIAEKVKFLIDHPADANRMASAAQEYVKGHLTWDHYIDGMAAVFRGEATPDKGNEHIF